MIKINSEKNKTMIKINFEKNRIMFKSVVHSTLLVSGNANNSTNAGLVNSNANNAPSNANTNIGSQLSFLIKRMETMPLGKK